MMEALLGIVDHVATITLNRPDKLNAWTAAMADQTRTALQTADEDPDVRVIVLTGAGRGFCAGADMSLLNSIVAGGMDAATSPASRRAPLPQVGKPLIAAVNGPAVGLGLALSIFCDLRLASETARFGTAFASRGLTAEFGLAWMLPRLVGLGNALDMLLTARLVEAQEARQIGLVNHILPEENFPAAVAAYARQIAATVSPRSTRIIKRQVYDGLSETLDRAFEVSELEMLASLKCEDFKEGVTHFVEKRPPAFTGR
jgi:enoyl-CoA hydratase/carnithine racemase